MPAIVEGDIEPRIIDMYRLETGIESYRGYFNSRVGRLGPGGHASKSRAASTQIVRVTRVALARDSG